MTALSFDFPGKPERNANAGECEPSSETQFRSKQLYPDICDSGLHLCLKV